MLPQDVLEGGDQLKGCHRHPSRDRHPQFWILDRVVDPELAILLPIARRQDLKPNDLVHFVVARNETAEP